MPDNFPPTFNDTVNPEMTTTSFSIEGWQTTKTLGVVRGISVRTRSIVGTVVGNLETLIGGRNTAFTELAERARREAFEFMLDHAGNLGANAIVGVRYDATGNGSLTEVLCYGTAVVVTPIS